MSQDTKHIKRLKVELTSCQGPVWTWRKVGAKHPKGEISADMLEKTASQGDELLIEVSTDIDGLLVESVISESESESENGKNGFQTLERVGEEDFKPVQWLSNGKPKKPKQHKKSKKQKTKANKFEEMPASKVPKGAPGKKLRPKSEHRTNWQKGFTETDEKPTEKKLAALIVEHWNLGKKDQKKKFEQFGNYAKWLNS